MSLLLRYLTAIRRLALVLLLFVAVLGCAAPAAARQVTASRATLEGLRVPAAARLESRQPAQPPSASVYDRLWRFAEWYRNDSARIVQRVQFTGRYQQDFAMVRADQGRLDEWNVRRMRLGGRVTMARAFVLHGEVDLNPQERDPFYVRLTDFYLQWSKSPQLVITTGKQGVPFTSEGATSSRELIAIDRSSLANNIWFPQEYMPGVSVSGRHAQWVYRAGAYSSGRMNREFGDFDGGAFVLAVLGYDVGRALGVREALVTGNYLYQQTDAGNTFTRSLRHVVSIHTRVEDRRWGARTDVARAAGFPGQSDLWSVMAMPFLNVTSKFQVVGRYTIVKSADKNGVRLATYEGRVVPGRGDRYDEVYAGANYYVYGHRLKVQTGLQWARMTDRADDGGAYAGTAWTSGVRVGW